MQAALRAMLDQYAAIPALVGVKAFNSLAPAGTAFPHCLYSCPSGGEVEKGLDANAPVRTPIIWQWSFFAAGKNANNLAVAGDYRDALVTAFDSIKTLPVTSGLLLSLRLILNRVPILDSYIADPSASAKHLPVYHALCQYELLYQQ